MEFLKARYGERASEPEFLGAGAWSSAYGFTLDGEPMVIRFGAYVEDFEKDRIASSFAYAGSSSLPVPEVLEVGGTPDGGYFAVSRRAYGTFLDELSGPEMAAALPALLSTLRTLRSIEPPGPGYGGWDASGRAPDATWASALLVVTEDVPGARVSGWRRLLAESSVGIEPFEAGVEVLRELAAGLPEIPRRLIHSDLLHRNVLVRSGPDALDSSESTVTAVFDWANAMYGDGLFDLAWLTYWWPWYPEWSSIDIRAAIEPDLSTAGSRAEVERRLLCCEIRIGLEHVAYNAFTGYWPEVEQNTRRTLDLLRSARG